MTVRSAKWVAATRRAFATAPDVLSPSDIDDVLDTLDAEIAALRGDGVTFGALIAKARENNGETLRAAAKRIGCSHVYLREIERGAKRVSAEKAPVIARSFGINPAKALRACASERVAAIRAEFNAGKLKAANG